MIRRKDKEIENLTRQKDAIAKQLADISDRYNSLEDSA